MSQSIFNGQSVTLPIQIGEKLTAVAVSGTYSVVVVDGVGDGTSLATDATGGTYGPYAYSSVVRVSSSALSEIDYDVGVTTSIVSDTVVKANTDGLTGRIANLTAGGHAFPSPAYGSSIIRFGDLTKIATAIDAWVAGSPVTVLRCGDSTTVGAGSGTATTWTAAAQRNCSAQFAALSAGLVSNDGFIGDAGLGGAPGYSVYNPNVTLGNGWAANTSSLGGLLFKFTAGGTGTLKMLIPSGTKKVRIYIVGGGGTATAQTDLGSVGSITVGGGLSVAYQEFTIQTGATYIEITAPSTTTYVLGMMAFNDAHKILLLNAGANGSLIAPFTVTTAAYDALNALKSIAPKMTVINLTINDANAPTAKATYQASLAALVEAAMLSGSVAIQLGAVSNTAASTNGSLYDIRAACMDIAEAYNLTVMSVPAAIGGGFSGANAAGNMFDTWHPTYAGYGQEAAKCWVPLLEVLK